MIESENLRTASLYINNQLLSRGLLRDGHNIDFAHPGDSEGEVAETMGRIMGVVNDLILRRDRDAEHRESLSATLRTLRAESLRQANDIQRLQEKHAEAQRKAGLSEAAEAALRTHLKTAEATIHRLKEEAARTKTLVAQTRASCANEVRKRDRQIESLKKAVTEAGRARGVGKSPAVTTITVTGDIGMGPETEQAAPPVSAGSAADQGYDLRSETNAFLAELAKGLSEENEGLMQLVRRTIERLKEMSGWDVTNGGGPTGCAGDGHALALAANPADMSLEVDAVLEHLRTILTNPSFVPIEEVVVREDEIHRLRDGWEKMETRWKEAVHLIDGWRKRMQASGRPVNVEELKMGLRLSPVRVRNVEETSQGLDLRLDAVLEDEEEADVVPHDGDEGNLGLVQEPEFDDGYSDASSMFDHNVDDVDVCDLDVEEPNVEILQQSVMFASPPLPPPPQLGPLRDSSTAGNRRERPDRGQRPVGFATITQEKTREVAGEDAPMPPPPPPPPSQGERPQQPPQKRPLLSLRTVPPEEAANVALPASAVVSTPDTSVENMPLSKATDEPATKPPRAATKAEQRPAPTPKKKEAVRKETTARELTQKKDREETKAPASRPPAKARPTKPPITRGRTETRKDEKGSHPTKATPRARSAASTASAASASSSKSAGAAKNVITDNVKAPRPPKAPAPAQSPSRSPVRANSRLPMPRPGGNGVLPAPQQSPLNMATIAAKLAASEREADAARVRAKLKAARLGKGVVSLPPPGTGGGGGGSGTAGSAATCPAEADAGGGGSGGGGGGTSTRSESDSAAGSASTAASASDAAPSSATTAARDEELGADAGADADADADADELGLSPPATPAGTTQQDGAEESRRIRHNNIINKTAAIINNSSSKTKNINKNDSSCRHGAADHSYNNPPPAPAAARKRDRRVSRTASRRRSTLNPWELDALIQGGVSGVSNGGSSGKKLAAER
ncbi:d54f55a5-bc32-4404-8c29-3f73088f85dc [Thermothielavioides terrestris]|uniref:D54f55a5-bc32-4404-8c29-3f73088f85dc n=1 Tax=Thermothielavioides terrestris TaxID=2587410 RepID=A0A446BID9_9PEZI|nr:d54f55a5-bc32-4404-8c29-3f73088f85dc [Thermothielavioides terrestris]